MTRARSRAEAGLLLLTGLSLLTGLAALAAGCGAAARGSSGELEESDPLDSVEAEELYRRGVLLAEAGDYVRAEQYLVSAIDRGFSEERALPALLSACIQASRFVAALEYAEPFLAQHPAQWQLRILVASIHMGLSHAERARDELERVLDDAAPEEPAQAHYFLGVLYRDALSNPEAATEHFRRYLAIEPDGAHRDEARADLPPAERGVPMRIEAEDVPPATAPAPTAPAPTAQPSNGPATSPEPAPEDAS